jgi:hypothetical protein
MILWTVLVYYTIVFVRSVEIPFPTLKREKNVLLKKGRVKNIFVGKVMEL